MKASCLSALFLLCLISCQQREIGKGRQENLDHAEQAPGTGEDWVRMNYTPIPGRDGGILWTFGEGETKVPEPYQNPSRGKQGDLELFTARIFNFEEYPMPLPVSMEKAPFRVLVDGRWLDLLPLSAFKDDFPFGVMIEPLKGNLPEKALPGRSWTKAYFACRMPQACPDRVNPAGLIGPGWGVEQSLPWVSKSAQEMEELLEHPSAASLSACTQTQNQMPHEGELRGR